MQTSAKTASILGLSPVETDRAYEVQEICERLSICRATLYNEARDKRINLKKIRNRTVVTGSEIARYLANLPDADLSATAA